MKHSALYEFQQRAGASFTEHHGWQVPASYTTAEAEAARVRRGAGLADVSWMVKLDLKGFGLKKGFSLEAGASCWALGSQHVLVTCDPQARNEVLEQLKSFEAAGADLVLPPPVYVTDVTSVYAEFLLAGPQSHRVLEKLSSLNFSEPAFPDRSCKQSSVAHVRATVLRQDMGPVTAFHLLVNRDAGESVWEAVMHAGREFEIAPFGLQAYEVLNG